MAQLPHHKVNLIRFGIIQRSLKLLLNVDDVWYTDEINGSLEN